MNLQWAQNFKRLKPGNANSSTPSNTSALHILHTKNPRALYLNLFWRFLKRGSLFVWNPCSLQSLSAIHILHTKATTHWAWISCTMIFVMVRFQHQRPLSVQPDKTQSGSNKFTCRNPWVIIIRICSANAACNFTRPQIFSQSKKHLFALEPLSQCVKHQSAKHKINSLSSQQDKTQINQTKMHPTLPEQKCFQGQNQRNTELEYQHHGKQQWMPSLKTKISKSRNDLINHGSNPAESTKFFSYNCEIKSVSHPISQTDVK